MKVLKWVLIIIAILGIVGYFGMGYLKKQTKKHSPEDTITYKSGDLHLSVYYNRPYKKGRVIFGDLVPYNEVWRTGANETTTFTTSREIRFADVTIPAGTYSLWTIPQETQWTVILNSKVSDWGVSFGGKPSRDPEYDVAKINVATQELDEVVEQFTMEFEYNVNLSMSWDRTKIMVPIAFY